MINKVNKYGDKFSKTIIFTLSSVIRIDSCSSHSLSSFLNFFLFGYRKNVNFNKLFQFIIYNELTLFLDSSNSSVNLSSLNNIHY